MEKDAFTVCAVGHSTDGTVLDPLSDLSCPTPTAAGSSIRARLTSETAPAPPVGSAPRASARRVRPGLVALAVASALFLLLLLSLVAWSAVG